MFALTNKKSPSFYAYSIVVLSIIFGTVFVFTIGIIEGFFIMLLGFMIGIIILFNSPVVKLNTI